ncbi:MAG: prepilin-type N-terminal cleavage/methylation domain-containing protein [Akkermansiaceae bacterium]|jgi:prepilin-type N-terminal cleavage/methylation domain-containing protein|nr:prepilin-type N-terminal cleavage/methylation domain-containing protein [Akkermansiaceae bacterium]
MKSIRKTPSGGFTLVELLVVIAIISILLTLGSVAMRNSGGKGVTAATATAEAVFEEARSIAVGKGTRARVLVDVDGTGATRSDSFLRRMVVAYEELDANGQPQANKWVLSSRGYSFPDKTYFSQVYSKRDHQGGSGDLEKMRLTGVSSMFEGEYAYYEFNSEGICTTGLKGSGDYSPPSFVVGSGVLPEGDTSPRITGDGKRDFGGFVIWRNGATSLFRDPSQILGSGDPAQKNF